MAMAQGTSPGSGGTGSKDGAGAGDRDRSYIFGRRPTVEAPSPFNSRELARLLVLRGRLQDGAFKDDRLGRYSLGLSYHMVWVGRDEDVLERPTEPN